MNKEERFNVASEWARKLDILNDRTMAFSETETESFFCNMNLVLGTIPCLWEETIGSRQQCYSNMFSKLFLAYLIEEIKEGNVLDGNALGRLSGQTLDDWNLFHYTDIGYKIASVLENIMDMILVREGYFDFDVTYIEVSDICGPESNEDIDEEIIYKFLIKNYPLLNMVIEEKKASNIFGNLSWGMQCHGDLETTLLVIESEVLYEIFQRESVESTDLGKDILSLSKSVFCNYFREDYLIYDLSWEAVDEENKKICYYMISCSELIGDDWTVSEEVFDRLHMYNYQNIFKIMELQEKMKAYMNS